MNTITSLTVVVTAGAKQVARPLRIVSATGQFAVAWKGQARPVSVTGMNTVAFDPATAEKLDLGATRAAKTSDIRSEPAKPAAVAPTAAAKPQTDVERIAALTKGLRLAEGRVAKNPNDPQAQKALATVRANLAKLGVSHTAEAAAQPAKPAASPEEIAAMAQAAGVDLLALINALTTRL